VERDGNDYGSLIAQWKVELIRMRALKYLFREDEVPDLEQVVVPQLLKATYDPQNPSGARERSFLIAIIDRQLMKVMRDRQRDVRKVNYESASVNEAVISRPESHELRLDVQRALARMTSGERRICEALMEGRSQAEIARMTGRSKAAICNEVRKLREKFQAWGLTKVANLEEG
jgi:RNA polymerase sigma factor (sigma-70 family)